MFTSQKGYGIIFLWVVIGMILVFGTHAFISWHYNRFVESTIVKEEGSVTAEVINENASENDSCTCGDE